MTEYKNNVDSVLHQEELDLQEVFQYFASWWKFILLLTFVGGAIGALVTYRASSAPISQLIVEPAKIVTRNGFRLYFSSDQMIDTVKKGISQQNLGGDGVSFEMSVNMQTGALSLSIHGPVEAGKTTIRETVQLLQQENEKFLKLERARMEGERVRHQTELAFSRNALKRLRDEVERYSKVADKALGIADKMDVNMPAGEYLDFLSEYRQYMDKMQEYETRRREVTDLESSLTQKIADLDLETSTIQTNLTMGVITTREGNPSRDLVRMVPTFATFGLLASLLISFGSHLHKRSKMNPNS